MMPYHKHTGLVGKLAKKSHLSYWDATQAGYFGLIKAANAYKPGGAAFSTFAYTCIKNEIHEEERRERKRTVNAEFDERLFPTESATVERRSTYTFCIKAIRKGVPCKRKKKECVMIFKMLWCGYSWSEISKTTGINRSTAYNYRDVMRKILPREVFL